MRLEFTHKSHEDKGFTLTEAIFTISILGIIMVAMLPFIRSVHTSWNVGDRRIELEQNARVGLEMMSHFIRQAKRIIEIPSTGSGNFIKFRDTQDLQTIIFFHNVATSAFYIGNSGLIRENDLVMRTIEEDGTTTNALLAKSLDSFTMNFRDTTGAITNITYRVTAIDISMELSDPQGLISDTVEVFSGIVLRPDVRMNRGVIVAAGSYVVELTRDFWVSGFSSANSVSINTSTGDCIVADTNNEGEILSLSLEECIRTALDNNRFHSASQYAVQIAEAQHKQALSAYWPRLNVGTAITLQDDDPNFVFPASEMKIPAMTMTIPEGFFFSGFPPEPLEIPIPEQAFTVPEQNLTLLDKTNIISTLNLVYPVYTGGKIAAINKQARSAIDIAKQDARRTDLKIIYDVKRYYYSAVLVRDIYEIGYETLARLEATLELTESLYLRGSGRVKKTDYLKNKPLLIWQD